MAKAMIRHQMKAKSIVVITMHNVFTYRTTKATIKLVSMAINTANQTLDSFANITFGAW